MSSSADIAVVGAGPVALSLAALLVGRGRKCVVGNRSPERLGPIRQRGGVEVDGDLDPGFVPLPELTTDLGQAVRDASLVLYALPAFAHLDAFLTTLPHLGAGTRVVFLSGSGASLEAACRARESGRGYDDLAFGETATPPLSARMTGPASVRVKLHATTRFGAFPGINTERIADELAQLFAVTVTPTALDPAVNNPNFLIHPAPMLLNYAEVERSRGELSLINEGMTEGVLRVLDAVDAEKMALQQALGLEVLPIDRFYELAGTGAGVYRSPGENFGAGYRDRIWDRYIDEDVPYGTVLYASLGRLAGVPTPVSDGINRLLSVVKQTDFEQRGRSLAALGLAGLDRAAVPAYLRTGDR
ncbi:NAD/NADP-dependent octopine/nopaline dehydrogenase family protein [Amycolatopsis jejuensis]|uniref:NAD/NADP-dependent octopine/nopaline dehydrogenase family protein n=1 Tax=Amycolatopsis jejuensis TaxID=330084 RepID=UPI000526B3DC|nr:NAD/NADP-dependent octopine/nopaline dehydrogenase family protein [Amycolatopsis jejuensis]